MIYFIISTIGITTLWLFLLQSHRFVIYYCHVYCLWSHFSIFVFPNLLEPFQLHRSTFFYFYLSLLLRPFFKYSYSIPFLHSLIFSLYNPAIEFFSLNETSYWYHINNIVGIFLLYYCTSGVLFNIINKTTNSSDSSR